jgi:radical SAM superfamily enzyme YgiQ (UPF0313 family)
MKLFLGDLVHTWGQISVWTMPLNVGYVAAHAKKHLGEAISEIRLFKRPERMIEAIKEHKPDVVALSYYVWNTNLNRRIHEIVRAQSPHTLIIGGGPIFTNHNADEEGARHFFSQQADCDLFVLNQGERGFLAALEHFLDRGADVARLRQETVPGCLVNNIAGNDRINFGAPLDAIRDLDEIPSPYLNGMFDEFFEEPIIPIIETNRSCPYRCTFCAWGIGTQKLTRFSEQRVLSEIDYIAEHHGTSTYLYVADANYGILERDAQFAEHMYKRHVDTGFPGHVGVQWNKTRPDRVLKTAEAFQGISEVGASMQSLNPDVLEAIKRRNLPLEQVAEINEQLKEKGLSTQLYSELILGLPLDTREGHLDANRKLMDLGAEVFNYNLHLLPGTEMDSEETRKKYFQRTGWRLHDNAFGVYDSKAVFEGQEVVIETTTMSMNDLRSFRFIHFLLQFMWGRKWYYDFLKLLRRRGLHPVDAVTGLAERFRTDEGEMGSLYEAFRRDHDLENFECFEDLAAYWGKDEHLQRLRDGSYGKLNYVYTYKILLEHMESFNDFLLGFASEIVDESDYGDKEAFLNQCREVLRFSDNLRVTVREDLSVVARKSAQFGYDILSWTESGSESELELLPEGSSVEYEFFLPEFQRDQLERQLAQFTTTSLTTALRQMSIDTSADQFFYQVRRLSGPEGTESDSTGVSSDVAKSMHRAARSSAMGMDTR